MHALMHAFADMAREVSHIAGTEYPDVKINVGDMTTFFAALDRAVGPIKDADPSQMIASAEFCGIKVIENDLLPRNMAAIIQDGAVINLIRFADG